MILMPNITTASKEQHSLVMLVGGKYFTGRNTMSKRGSEAIVKSLAANLSRRQFVKRLVQVGAGLGLGLSARTAFAASCTGFLSSVTCAVAGSLVVVDLSCPGGAQKLRGQKRTMAIYSNGKQTSGTQTSYTFCPGGNPNYPTCETTCG